MIQPTYYSAKVHSYLNALTGLGFRNNRAARWTLGERFKKVDTLAKALHCYDFYCHINKGRSRPSAFNIVIKAK
jgi:hypothetical protein